MKRRRSHLEETFDRVDQLLAVLAVALATGAGYAFHMGWP